MNIEELFNINYTDFQLKDLAGKKVKFFTVTGGPGDILKQYGATPLTYEFLPEVDYVLCNQSYNLSQRELEYNYIKKLIANNPDQKFIRETDLYDMVKNAFLQTWESETLNQKLERAKDLFHKCMIEVNEFVKEYRIKISDSTIKVSFGGDAKNLMTEGIHRFFDHIVEHYETQGMKALHCMDSENLRKGLVENFTYLKQCEESYLAKEYEGSAYLPIGIAIAWFVFRADQGSSFLWYHNKKQYCPWSLEFSCEHINGALDDIRMTTSEKKLEKELKKRKPYEFVYSEYKVEDLKDKRVLTLFEWDRENWKKNNYDLSYVLERVGAKKGTSKEFDYILCEDTSVFPKDKDTMNIIDSAQKKTDKNDFPQFIHYTELIEFAKKIKKQDQQECYKTATPKAAKAMKLFDKHVLKINQRMDAKNYLDPFVECGVVKAKRDLIEDIDMEGVNEFFDYVAEHYEKYTIYDADYADSEELRNTLVSAFRDMMKDPSWDISGYAGVRLPLSLAIAAAVFVDENSKIVIEFARSRWEVGSTGYKRVAFCLDSDNPEGVVVN